MRRFLLIVLVLVSSIVIPVTINAESGSRIVVYYFHGDFRCQSCMKIERLTELSLKNYFRGELSSKKLVWKVVNVDDNRNAQYKSRYSINSRSVLLSRIVNGREAEWKNLDRVWDYLRNKNAFKEYIAHEVKSFLEK